MSNHRWSEREPDRPAIERSVKPTQNMHVRIRSASGTCSHAACDVQVSRDILLLMMSYIWAVQHDRFVSMLKYRTIALLSFTSAHGKSAP